MSHGVRVRWDDDQEFIETKIRIWRRIAARTGLCRGEDELDDLTQEIMLALAQRMSNYSPSKGKRRTYIAMIIEHRVMSYAKELKAAKRGRSHPHVSLDIEINVGPTKTAVLREVLTEEDYLRATRRHRTTGDDRRALAIDLERALSRLTPLEAEVCRRLDGHTKKDAADAMGIPRTTLQDIVGRIAAKWSQAGLKEYLE